MSEIVHTSAFIETAQIAIHVVLGTAALAMAIVCLVVLVMCVKNMIQDILEQRQESKQNRDWAHMPGLSASS